MKSDDARAFLLALATSFKLARRFARRCDPRGYLGTFKIDAIKNNSKLHIAISCVLLGTDLVILYAMGCFHYVFVWLSGSECVCWLGCAAENETNRRVYF